MSERFELASFEFLPATIAPNLSPSTNNTRDALCFVVAEVGGNCDQILCDANQRLHLFTLPNAQSLISSRLSSKHFLGVLDSQELWVLAVTGLEPVAPYQWQGLRSQSGVVPEAWFLLAGRALQVAQWYYDHLFCGRCGKPTETDSFDRAHVCKPCNLRFYPRISPCMIVLVTRGDEILLAHHARASRPVYTTLAGFVEAGERVEDAVHREVKEEVGISLGKLEFFSSQPWPFPSQLMLGFFAEYETGEICIDGVEILDAQWFHCDDLPDIPSANSIAGQLIRHYVKHRQLLNTTC